MVLPELEREVPVEGRELEGREEQELRVLPARVLREAALPALRAMEARGILPSRLHRELPRLRVRLSLQRLALRPRRSNRFLLPLVFRQCLMHLVRPRRRFNLYLLLLTQALRAQIRPPALRPVFLQRPVRPVPKRRVRRFQLRRVHRELPLRAREVE